MACITRIIENTDGNYLADTDGNIYAACFKGTKGGIISLAPNKYGYIRISMRKNGKRYTTSAHRIIAETFIPNPLNLKYVNHINGIRSDNRVVNLEWCTQSYNMLYAYRVLKNTPIYPKNTGRECFNKLTEADLCELEAHLKSGKSRKEFADAKNITIANVSNVINGYSWRHIAINWEPFKFPDKLTEDDVYELKRHLENNGTRKEFAIMKNVKYNTIDEIIAGRNWKRLNIDWSQFKTKNN